MRPMNGPGCSPMIDLTLPVPPLDVPGFPVKGPTGERDNIERLYQVMGALLPRGRLLVLDIAHDVGCPCESRDRPMPSCTCATVDLRLSLADPRLS